MPATCWNKKKSTMPLYEYECDNGHRFEKIQKFSDPQATECPTCGAPVHKLFSSPAIQFKGSGWYITDYAKKEGTAAGKSGGSAGEASSEKSSDAKSDTAKADAGKSESGKSDSAKSESSTPSTSTPAASPSSDSKKS